MKKNSFGTKTAIALAVAAFAAGAAVAADPAVKLEGDMTFTSDVVINKDTTGDTDNTWGFSPSVQPGDETTGFTNWVINGGTMTVQDYEILAKKPAESKKTGVLTLNAGTINVEADKMTTTINGNHIAINGGTINLTGNEKYQAAFGSYDDFTMTGGTINVGQNGKVWLSTDRRPDRSCDATQGRHDQPRRRQACCR